MCKVLVVVDMQNDFIGGSLGTAEAVAVVPRVVRKIKRRRAEGWRIVFTQDTHGEDYLLTQEGKNLPVPHCIQGTYGWRLQEDIAALAAGCPVYEKGAFGSGALWEALKALQPEEVELCGVCTDICVVSNALGVKAFLPEARVTVDGSCCAGTSAAAHASALEVMASCQVALLQEGE